MIRKNIRRNSGYLRRHSSIISGIHPLYLSRDQEREGYEDSEERPSRPRTVSGGVYTMSDGDLLDDIGQDDDNCSSDNEVLERVSSPSSTNTESRGSFQKNKRYLSQEKVPEVVESRGMLLDPDGPWYYRWMLLVTCMVLYNIIVIILRAAFKETREQEVPYWTFYVLDSLADFIFIVDVIIQSHVTYYKDGCLVFDKQKIFRKYTKNIRFKIDVISILPIHSISLVVWGAARFFYASLPTINTIDGGIVMPVLRFPRLTKTKLLPRFFDVTDSRTTHPNGVRAVKLSLYLCMVIHWIACLYYILSEYEGLHSNEWVYAGNETDSFSTKYIRCVYWSLLILTTIGERPPPQTDLEYVFTGMTFVIGVFLFAAVVGNVGDVISNMNASRQEFQARMDQIKFYMHHRNIPKSLQDRVKRWSEYNWSRNQCMDESQMLQMLPQKLQMEMAIQVHLETLKKVKMFEECEEGLLRELVLKLKSQMFLPGDYICHIGDIGKEMYIINHGKIEILVPNGKNGTRTVVAKLRAGNYFGEISLLQLEHGHNRRTADVRSVGYSELLCLSRKDLINALVEYPVAKKILETQAKERMRQITGLGNKKTDSVSEDVVDSPLESNTPTSLVPLSMCVVDNNDRERLLVRKNSRKNHDTVDDKIAQLEKQIKELELKIRNILSAVEKKRSVSLRLERKQSSLEDSLSETDVFPYTVSSPVKNQEIAQDTSLNTLDAVKIERQLKDLSYSETFVVNDSNELNEMNSKQILPAPTTHRRAPPNWSTILKHSNMKLRQNSNHKWFSGKKPQSSLSCDLKDQTRQSSGYSSDLDSTSRAKSMSAFKSGRFNSTESERTNQDVDLSDNENYTYSLTNMNKQSNKCKETDV